MDTVYERSLAEWVMSHAEAEKQKLYFTINGDVPLTDNEGSAVVYQIPVRGKWVCVLHPDHLTQVAQICYAAGVQMVQVML
jgi:hypothetical protein